MAMVRRLARRHRHRCTIRAKSAPVPRTDYHTSHYLDQIYLDRVDYNYPDCNLHLN